MNVHVKHVTAHLRHVTNVAEIRFRKNATSATLALVALLSVSFGVTAQTAPSLGSEAPFGIVSSTFTNTAAGTTINGNVCFTTGPVFPATVTGTTGPCPAAAGTDQTAALAILNGQACTPLPAGPLEAVVIGTNPAGTIPPGCYTRAGAIDITASGIVTLNGNGVYIFRSTGGAVTTGATSRIVLAGGACADNVFWAPAGATTLGAASTFVGNILDAAGVAVGLGASLTGRALAFGGTVSTSSSTITVPGACAAPPPPAPGTPDGHSDQGVEWRRGCVRFHRQQRFCSTDHHDGSARRGRLGGDTDADSGGGGHHDYRIGTACGFHAGLDHLQRTGGRRHGHT